MLIASDKSNSREDQKQQTCEEIGGAWEMRRSHRGERLCAVRFVERVTLPLPERRETCDGTRPDRGSDRDDREGLEPLNRENRGHSVLLPWCKIDRSVQDIAGLDAEKLPPFAIAQVLQARCPFAPRIPHHCTERMFLP
jgi:hypothetical protein